MARNKIVRRKKVLWTDLELDGLVEDEDSCVYWNKIKTHQVIHPSQLNKKNLSLNDILGKNINYYDPTFNGFPLSYKNPTLLTDLGAHFSDTCFIHVDVEAEFYVFKPVVGKCLKGIVNKKSVNHLRVLVHRTFDVSIQRPESGENWVGENVSVDQEVKFTIASIDFDTRIPVIRGLLDPSNYTEGCQLFVNNHVEEEPEDSKSIFLKPKIENVRKRKRDLDENHELDIHSSPKKSKKSISTHENADFESQDELSSQTFQNETETSAIQENGIKKKKSKKKSKHSDRSSEADSEGYVSACQSEFEGKKFKKELREKLFNSEAANETMKIVQENNANKKKSKKRKNADLNQTDELIELKSEDNSNESENKKKSKKHKNANQLDESVEFKSEAYLSETESNKKYKKQLQDQFFNSANETTEAENEVTPKKSKKKSKHGKKNSVADFPESSVLAYQSESENKNYKKELHKKLFNSDVANETIEIVPENNTVKTKSKKHKNAEADQLDESVLLQSEAYLSETEYNKKYKKLLHEKLFSSGVTNGTTKGTSSENEVVKKKSKNKNNE